MDTEEIFQKKEQQSTSNINQNFTNRQKNLFEELDKAEGMMKNKITPQEALMDVDTPIILTKKRKRSETSQFRGKESIFKRPEIPLSKCLPVRSLPDHKRNPHKWTKYSLGDVPHEDMSEKSNTSAALSFLRELEERKTADSVENDEIELDTKITFRKHISQPRFNKSSMIKTDIDDSEEKGSFKGSKIVMPEYVIGQKVKPIKKNKMAKEKTNEKIKEIKLDHLLEEDDN